MRPVDEDNTGQNESATTARTDGPLVLARAVFSRGGFAAAWSPAILR